MRGQQYLRAAPAAPKTGRAPRGRRSQARACEGGAAMASPALGNGAPSEPGLRSDLRGLRQNLPSRGSRIQHASQGSPRELRGQLSAGQQAVGEGEPALSLWPCLTTARQSHEGQKRVVGSFLANGGQKRGDSC